MANHNPSLTTEGSWPSSDSARAVRSWPCEGNCNASSVIIVQVRAILHFHNVQKFPLSCRSLKYFTMEPYWEFKQCPYIFLSCDAISKILIYPKVFIRPKHAFIFPVILSLSDVGRLIDASQRAVSFEIFLAFSNFARTAEWELEAAVKIRNKEKILTSFMKPSWHNSPSKEAPLWKR